MNLPDLIKTGESTTVEFKEKFDERCIESLVAFANTRGGVIFIGVSDKNNIKGINIGKETINQWVNQISQSTEPRLIPEIEKIQIDGKTVVAVQIKEYPIKPVSTKGRCFKRVEALINAVCHRDYTILSHIEIRIYEDRLVIWSPGHLPFGIILEDLYKPHSSTPFINPAK